MYFILLLLWVIYNERLNLEVLSVGIVICGILYFFMRKFMNYNLHNDIQNLKKMPKYISFLFIVIIEILKSNLVMLKAIFFKGKEFKPVIIEFESPIKKKSLQVALANCITLTPSTYTLKLIDGVFVVYALNEKSVENIENSIYVKKLKEFEV